MNDKVIWLRPDEWEAPALDLTQRIGGGASGELFPLADGRALKMLRRGRHFGLAEREFVATRAAEAAGVEVAHPYGLVRIGGRFGMVVDRLDGVTLARRLRRKPRRVASLINRLATYQARLHASVLDRDALPSLHDTLSARIGWSDATPEAVSTARAQLAACPDGDRLCHGDLHFGNAMMVNRQVVAIDWSQSSRGDPAADVARTWLLLRFGSYGRWLRRFPPLRLVRWWMARRYLATYRAATEVEAAQVELWLLPVAVAWLHKATTAHRPSLERFIDRRAG